MVDSNWFRGTNGYSSIDFDGSINNITFQNNLWTCAIANYQSPFAAFPYNVPDVCNGIKFYNNTFDATPKNGGEIQFNHGNSTVSTMFYNVDIRNNIIQNAVNGERNW